MAGGIPIASGFKLGSQEPVDLRDTIDTYANLLLMPVDERYEGMIVYAKDTKIHYSLDSDFITWIDRDSVSGGSGGDTLYTDQNPSTVEVGGVLIGYKPKVAGISTAKLLSLILHAGSTSIVIPPIVNQSSSNNLVDVATNLSYITFNVTDTINSLLQDSTLVTSNIAGIINNVQLVGTILYVYLNPLDTGTTYSITVGSGTISNNGDDETSFGESTNTTDVTCTFETVWLPKPSAPLILQSSLDGTINQPISLSEITFNVSNSMALSLADGTKVISTPSGFTGIATLIGNTIHVPLSGLVNLTTYNITIESGIVENNGDNVTTARNQPNMNTVMASFKTIAPNVSSPIVQQSLLNGTTEQSIYTNEITFQVSNAIGMTLLDGSKVSISSSGINATIGNATLDALNILHIPITTAKLEYSTTYSITVLSNIVENHGDGVNQLGISANTNTITASFSTTTKPKPIIPLVEQSLINNTTVVSINLSEIIFHVSNDFNLSLNDGTKITCNKTGITGTVTFDSATKLIHIPIIKTLDYYTSYSITVQSGIVQNAGDNINTFGYSLNTNTITATFITQPTTVTQPVVTQSSINGLTGQLRTLAEITFPINNAIGVVMKDISKIICDHTGVIGTPYISSNTIHIPITMTLGFITTYSITIDVGAIENHGDGISALATNLNSNVITASFTTLDRGIVSAPVIQQSALNNAINQSTSLSEITFNVSNAIGLTLANGLKVTASSVSIINTATLVGNVIHIPLSGLNSGTTYTVTIQAGIVENNGDNISTSGSTLNSNTITATFKTLAGIVSSPIVQQSSLNGSSNQQITLNEITFSVSNAIGMVLKNGNNVTISPSGSIGIATLDSSNIIHVPLNGLTYNTSYSVTILGGIVENNGDGITSSGIADNINDITVIFTTRAKLTNPIITTSTVMSYPVNTTQVIYSLNQSGCTVLDTSKITVTGANKGNVTISGNQLIVSIGGLVEGNTVAVSIGNGAITNSDGVNNTAISDYTFTITSAVTALPPHDWELLINWSVGVGSMNLTTYNGYSPTSPLTVANYTAQKIQVYFLGTKGDLDSGIPVKNQKIFNRDFESSSADQSLFGKWYMSSAGVMKITKSPTTNIEILMIRLT